MRRTRGVSVKRSAPAKRPPPEWFCLNVEQDLNLTECAASAKNHPEWTSNPSRVFYGVILSSAVYSRGRSIGYLGIVTVPVELNDVFVTKDLELLTDFVSDVLVAGILVLELRFKRINVIQCKSRRKLIDAVPDIKKPSSGGNGLFFQKQCIMVLLHNNIFFSFEAVFYNENPAITGNLGELYQASGPACTSCGCPQRRSWNNDPWMEKVFGNNKKASYRQSKNVICEEKQIRIDSVSDRINHLLIITGEDSRSEIIFG